MVGIIQEQHPDRCRLFMQWKQMDWPVLVDSYNLLGVSVVPITLAVDEHGIIRHTGLRRVNTAWLTESFVDQQYDKPTEAGTAPRKSMSLKKARKQAEQNPNVENWRAYADLATRQVRKGDSKHLSLAIEAYEKCLSLNNDEADLHFRLGTAYRKRYDSSDRRSTDFQKAVDHWNNALALDPNNYIWRRRIQQYGPRLMKPYPFYDWIQQARDDVRDRGKTPAELVAEPSGAELAHPSRNFQTAESTGKEPDPKARITRDGGALIKIETTVVPPIVTQGGAARVHLVFVPNGRVKSHWNNEAGDSVLWIDPPQGWRVDRRLHVMSNAPKPVSHEMRSLEFEIRCLKNANSGKTRIPAYALYYVCEGADGKCLYRRQDVSIEVEISD